MALPEDYVNLFSDLTGLTEYSRDGAEGLDTGELRRRYSFGPRIAELRPAQDPFMRFLMRLRRNPTDDPQFKYVERRASFQRRYSYVIAHAPDPDTPVWAVDGAIGDLSVGDRLGLKMSADYLNTGNVTNVYRHNGTAGYFVGGKASNYATQPKFFMTNSLIKVNVAASLAANIGVAAVVDYMVLKILAVTYQTGAAPPTDQTDMDAAILDCEVVKANPASTLINYVADYESVEKYKFWELDKVRSFVIGNAFGMGSGYGETWSDQPFSTAYGQTQIVKTNFKMDNSTRATIFKLSPNEFMRMWAEKLIEHKWDLEQMSLFASPGEGTDADGNKVLYTQGAVDYIQNYGNVFDLDPAAKTVDDFLADLSVYLNPRVGVQNMTLFFADTETYNWLMEVGGYAKNNYGLNAGIRFNFTGITNALQVPVANIRTSRGQMNVIENVHLNSTEIKLLGINLANVAYRPLVGNGLNRDTTVYVGVQRIETTGVDRQVDLIQTDAGLEWSLPESHAIWKKH